MLYINFESSMTLKCSTIQKMNLTHKLILDSVHFIHNYMEVCNSNTYFCAY